MWRSLGVLKGGAETLGGSIPGKQRSLSHGWRLEGLSYPSYCREDVSLKESLHAQSKQSLAPLSAYQALTGAAYRQN